MKPQFHPLSLPLVFLIYCSASFAANAPRSTIYSFAGPPDGSFPYANVISDSQGNLFGTTQNGGTGDCQTLEPFPGCGTVFQLAPSSVSGGPWTETVLYSFHGSDGALPTGGLIRDAHGDLYGTTQVGGTNTCLTEYGEAGCGAVFQLSPPLEAGGTWTEKVLYSFQGNNDGLQPYAGLVFDTVGNLYGTTLYGGVNSCGCGTVFKLTRPTASGGAWTEQLLYSFNDQYPDQDGQWPYAPLVFDSKGNLYGTTISGGDQNTCGDQYYFSCGTVFELSPPADSGNWRESLLNTFYSFGTGPAGGLIFDKQGNLYGTTVAGPPLDGDFAGGIIFKLSPPQQSGGTWTKQTIYEFNDNAADQSSYAGLIFDKDGNLFGTSAYWPNGRGSAFELVHASSSDGSWAVKVLSQDSNSSSGYEPKSSLTWGYRGALYGTTPIGGSTRNCGYGGVPNGCGTVFMVIP